MNEPDTIEGASISEMVRPCTVKPEQNPFPNIHKGLRVPIQGWNFRITEITGDGQLKLKVTGPSNALVKRMAHDQRKQARTDNRERAAGRRRKGRSSKVKSGNEPPTG